MAAGSAYNGVSSERYRRNITEQNINADLYLLEVASGRIERLTDNDEVGESGPFFSPDSRHGRVRRARRHDALHHDNRRVYMRPVASAAASSASSAAVIRRAPVHRFLVAGRPHHLLQRGHPRHAAAARAGRRAQHRPPGHERAGRALRQPRRRDTGVILISYQDPATPTTFFTVPTELEQVQSSGVAAAHRREPAGPQTSRWAGRKRSPGPPPTASRWAAC
jgi:hypothetical protein